MDTFGASTFTFSHGPWHAYGSGELCRTYQRLSLMFLQLRQLSIMKLWMCSLPEAPLHSVLHQSGPPTILRHSPPYVDSESKLFKAWDGVPGALVLARKCMLVKTCFHYWNTKIPSLSQFMITWWLGVSTYQTTEKQWQLTLYGIFALHTTRHLHGHTSNN